MTQQAISRIPFILILKDGKSNATFPAISKRNDSFFMKIVSYLRKILKLFRMVGKKRKTGMRI